jgi:hypothetical protein
MIDRVMLSSLEDRFFEEAGSCPLWSSAGWQDHSCETIIVTIEWQFDLFKL